MERVEAGDWRLVVRKPPGAQGQGSYTGELTVLLDEGGEPLHLRVIAIEGDTISLDANHPLAGQELHFDVSVQAVRPASEEELAHGHVHGHGGAHH